MHMHMGAHGGHGGVSAPLELWLHVVVSHHTWVLVIETKFGSSARAVCVNC